MFLVLWQGDYGHLEARGNRPDEWSSELSILTPYTGHTTSMTIFSR